MKPFTRIGMEAPSTKYFKGELMACCMCPATERSSPGVASNWRVLEVDGRPYYFCRAHFPPDGSTKQAYQAAYAKCLDRVLELVRSGV